MKFSIPQLDSINAMQIFQVLRQGGLILVAICMSKGLMTNDQIGNWELLTFLGFSTTFFWLDGLLKTFIADSEKVGSEKADSAQNKLFQTYALIMFMMAVVAIVFLFGKDSFIPQLLGLDKIEFLHIFTAFLFLNVPIAILPAYYLIKKRNRSLLLFGLWLGCMPPLCVLLTTGIGQPLIRMYQAFLLFAIISHALIWIELFQLKRWSFLVSDARRMLTFAWPLMLYAVAVSMAKVFDGWLVSWFYRDESVFAIFRYGAREFPLTVALTAGMTLAFIPLLQANRTEALEIIKKRSMKIMHILFPIVCFLMLISTWAFRWVFRIDFESSALIFNVYLLLILSQVLFPQAILLAEKKNKVILITSLIELIFNIGLSIILIQYWGLEGVAIATVIAYLIEKLIYIQYIHKTYLISPNQYLNLKVYGAYFVLTCIFFSISLMI